MEMGKERGNGIQARELAVEGPRRLGGLTKFISFTLRFTLRVFRLDV
jgi:hypothetical protein